MIKNFLTIVILILANIGAVSAANDDAVFTVYPTHTHMGDKQWIISDVKPGKTYSDELTLQNLSDSEITLKIEVKETRGTRENIEIIENEEFHDIGKWIKPEKTQITLAAKTQTQLKVRFEIPKTAALREYQGTILVSNTKKSSNSTLNIATRLGTRVYLNISDKQNIKASLFEHENNLAAYIIMGIAFSGLAYSLIPAKKSL